MTFDRQAWRRALREFTTRVGIAHMHPEPAATFLPPRTGPTPLLSAFIGLAACTFALATGARAESLHGTASVVAGGTIQLRGELIRLMDIEVPAREHFCVQAAGDTAWRCGEQAAIALLNLVGSAMVTCHSEMFDQFGRHLGRCTVAGRDVAVELAESGWAIPRDDCECEEIRAAALRAQADRLGIWSDPFLLPWQRPAVYYLGDAQH